ncbi:hypothetical protein [Leminorella grimontii]|uniref:hypothetical protein n=1 Tax=Leminorella grimontii TaxID=82981 RepID=UPI002085093F|nr:hypothetical protein [Leminorella grimontii]GKX58677.1 hypothetical protein SOASR031_09920 [Leminorella grimontii]
MSKSSEVKLAKVVADLAVFLEFTGEEQLDPDSAVEAMEQMAGELQSLDDKERENLTGIFIELSNEYEGDKSLYVRGLPEFLGL